jgi:DeoR/GlpR family transcriptional regulator of sugar metabolism
MIGSTQQLFAVVDSSKFGKEDLTPIAKLENIDKLYTDARISPEWKERLLKVGIDIIICNQELH